MSNLEHSMFMLRASVHKYLLVKVFTPRLDCDEADLWATAMMNTLLLTQPHSQQLENLIDVHEDKVWLEALQIKRHQELSGPSGGASYLYFAEMCFATDLMNEPTVDQFFREFSRRSWAQHKLESDISRRQSIMARHNKRYIDLRDRADQLGIFIPTAKNVCDSSNPLDIVKAIRMFASEFTQKYDCDFYRLSFDRHMQNET